MNEPSHRTNDQCLSELRRAREYITRGWCRYKRGTDKYGQYCEGFDPEAVKWCALGAIDAALGRQVRSNDCAVRDVARHLPLRYRPSSDYWMLESIADFNNETSQQDVLALFDAAIADHLIGAGFAAFRAATLSALERVDGR